MTSYDHATMPRRAGVATPHAASPRSPLPGAARWYARRGFPLVPLHHVLPDGACSCMRGGACDRIGKHPRTEHGVKDASTDDAQIAAWWRRWPPANIGAATGVQFDVLDIDLPDLDRWQRETGRTLPATWHAVSGSGGHHLYFRPAAGLGNGVRRLPFADTRAAGGYIVLPPSRNAAGAYRWQVPPGAVPRAAWPVDLLAALLPPARPGPRTTGTAPPAAPIPDGLRRFAAAGATAGERNSTAFWLACRLRQHGADERAAEELLLAFAAACSPSMDPEEAQRIWRGSAQHQGYMPGRCLPPPRRMPGAVLGPPRRSAGGRP